jgi:hypothetical protein
MIDRKLGTAADELAGGRIARRRERDDEADDDRRIRRFKRAEGQGGGEWQK